MISQKLQSISEIVIPDNLKSLQFFTNLRMTYLQHKETNFKLIQIYFVR